MKIFTYILFFCLIATATKSQDIKQIEIPKNKKGDTSLWFKWQNERIDKLKLPTLLNKNDESYLRVTIGGQIIDIWSYDNKTYQGIITNFADGDNSKSTRQWVKKDIKTFSNKVVIDTIIAKSIFKLQQQISSIPTEQLIKGWGIGNDGVEYIIETSNPKYYVFKTYWTPTVQDSTLKEAKKIQDFIDKISVKLNLEKEYEYFFETLPPGLTYTYDGFMYTCKPTKKNLRKYKKDKG
jgi:hypothetical protein